MLQMPKIESLIICLFKPKNVMISFYESKLSL